MYYSRHSRANATASNYEPVLPISPIRIDCMCLCVYVCVCVGRIIRCKRAEMTSARADCRLLLLLLAKASSSRPVGSRPQVTEHN